MINGKPVVGITQGDSNGIGYEVIIKALSDSRILDLFTPVIYGSSKLLGFYKKTIHELDQMDTNLVSSAREAHAKRINIVNCLPDSIYAEPGASTAESAKAAITSLELAVKEAKEGYIDILVTAPINKKAMAGEGFGFPGHTEYLQNAFGVKDITMLMVSDNLKIGVVTGHIPLKDVPGAINVDKIISKLTLLNKSMEQDFGISSPKIAVLSLNPHSGDGGLLGTEEQSIIIPAIRKANTLGINAYGPFSPDGFFGMGRYQQFDATLALYHDQGLSPFKALESAHGVNYSAGLPIVRTSPDHGTAFELAGRDEADPRSMRAAIFTGIDILRHRQEYAKLMENRIDEKYLRNEENDRNEGKPQIA